MKTNWKYRKQESGSIRDEGYVFCFTEDGEFLWRGEVGGSVRGLAYGNGTLFVSSEPSKLIYAFDIRTGKKLWVYEHVREVLTPVYKQGKVLFIDNGGYLTALSSFDGKLLWRKNIGGGGDVNTNSYLAVHNLIYTPRVLGEKPLSIYVIDFNGDIIGEFTLNEGERAGSPVITRDIVILPVVGKEYGKIYFLWRGVAKVYEFKFRGEEIYMPKVSVAYGEVYAIFSYDRLRHLLIKFKDFEKPVIKDVNEVIRNGIIEVKVVTRDQGSGIHKALIAYQEGTMWHYVEMEIARKYVIEPIGGYGFNEEEYIASIPNNKNKYVIIIIDNVGNYVLYE